MNLPLILELVQLRYKLLWAKTRHRNGRIALFLTGYLLLVLIVIVLSMGGFGAALVGVRSGKGEKIAQAILTAIFFQAILATNILGFGMNAVFSDTELRRYPLTASDRRLARNLADILDPFWFLFLALELGMAVGYYAVGASGFWAAMTAMLLFFLCSYAAARVVALVIDQLVKRRGGPAILLSLVITSAMLPAALAPLMKKNPHLGAQFIERLAFTPPFLGAKVLTGQWTAMPALILWIAALAAVVIYLEKRPPQRRASSSTKVAWDSPFDRIGALYGPRFAPFVSHWLRFYARNTRTRTIALISLPLAGFLTFTTGSQIKNNGFFVAALGTIGISAFMTTSRFTVNQFGYSGGGFRRYFLLPTDPADTLRAASFAAVTIGAGLLGLALLLWSALVPLRIDARMIAMLLASGLTALLLFSAAGLWVTLYNPRKGNYNSSFGNDLSLGGNIVLIGGMILALSLPRLLAKLYPAAVSSANWWALLPLPPIAAVLYLLSLRFAAPMFNRRREKLLAVVEGKD